MNKSSAFVVGTIIGFAPLIAVAQTTATDTVAVTATAPSTVNLGASELASFVLSTVSLVVSGIALSRTRRHHRVHHTSAE